MRFVIDNDIKKKKYIYIHRDRGENERNWLKKMVLPRIVFASCRRQKVFEFFE